MKLSIVIRCRNEADSLRLTLEALRHQKCDFDREVILVDNESSDDSVSIAKEFGARLASISAAEFTYGRALNLGFSIARGELVMPLSAHSILLGEDALSQAVRPFTDPQVAGARCLAADSGLLAKWFSPVDLQKRAFQTPSPSAIPIVDPEDWHTKKHPNNACSVIRKSVWEKIPFDETLASSEDRLWALQALEAGYKIRHCAFCLYLYHRTMSPSLIRTRHRRTLLAAYLSGTRPALSFTGMLYRMAKAPVNALRVGAKTARDQLYEELNLAHYLYKLPYHARQDQAGSKAEFDTPSK